MNGHQGACHAFDVCDVHIPLCSSEEGDAQLNVCGSVSTPNVLMLQAQRVETVWQAACWRQTDIAVLMLQAQRVEMVWQAASWRQTDIAVLMLQAQRVETVWKDRQTLLCWCCRHREWRRCGQAARWRQTLLCWCCRHGEWTNSRQAACCRQTDIHYCVDVAGTESGQMVWQAACCCRQCDPTCTSPSWAPG